MPRPGPAPAQETRDPAARYLVAEHALDRAEALTARAYRTLLAIAARGADAKADTAGRGELAEGAPATGFAAVHLGADPREAAAMARRADLDATMPALVAALRERKLSRRVHQQLAAKAVPEHADAWARRIRELPHVQLRRLVEAAEVGQDPATIDPTVWDITDGLLPDGRWRFALNVAFDAEGYDSFERAWKHANTSAKRTLTPLQAIGAWAEALRGTSSLAHWRETVPRRDWNIDQNRQVAWLGTGRGGLGVALDAVPRASANARWTVRRDGAFADYPSGGPGLLVRVQREDGTLVELAPAALAAANPALVLADGMPRAARRRAVREWERGGRGPRAASLVRATSTPAEAAAAEALLDRCDLATGAPPPDPTTDELRALAPSGARVGHRLERERTVALAEAAAADAVEFIDEETVRVGCRPTNLARRDASDRIAIGQALPALPWTDRGFAVGALSYGKVRALARVATADTDARWAGLARASDIETLEALVAAAKRDEPPPRVPRGEAPLWPVGRPVRQALYGFLEGGAAAEFAKWRARLDALARRKLPAGDALAALAGLYLNRCGPRPRDLIVYHLSPESRGARDPRTLLAPAICAARGTTERLKLAFAFLAVVWDRIEKRSRRGSRHAAVAAPLGGGAASDSAATLNAQRSTLNGVRPTRRMRASMAARDGGVCVVPFCRNTLSLQWGHYDRVADGARADLARDFLICGRCNRAQEAGDLVILRDAEGVLRCLDRHDRPFDPRRWLGAHLDGPLLARLWADACAAVGVDVPVPDVVHASQVLGGAGSRQAGAPLRGGAPRAFAQGRDTVGSTREGSSSGRALGLPEVGGTRVANPPAQDSLPRGRPPDGRAAG